MQVMRPKRATRAERTAKREASNVAEIARQEARAQWIEDNPDAHLAEQLALEASRQERIALENAPPDAE